ncbi:MAG: hypothetical protein KDA80_07330, partial [Planctomycetaceae bacterium]|nr:hypothetical protein [Planctomycetaceae bacterium]
RPAFTLVELLVALGIFIILATLTVGAFQTSGPDRISAATADFKNALEGARSRAIRSGEVRGLRLLTDPQDGRIITSMIYVGSAGEDTGSLRIEFDPTASPPGWEVTNEDSMIWQQLTNKGLLKEGNQIEFPVDSGNWYTLSSQVDADTWTIAGHYPNSEWFQPSTMTMPTQSPPLVNTWRPGNFDPTDIPTSMSYSPQGRPQSVISLPMTYRVKLSAGILPGADPITFQRDTCIDLDGSVIPGRDSSGDYSSSQFDILFSPRGVLTGGLATAGVVIFRIASVSDLLLARDSNGRIATGTGAAVVADPEKGHKAVGIFCQTGGTIVGEVATSDTNGTFNDQILTGSGVNNAYQLIYRGKEASN